MTIRSLLRAAAIATIALTAPLSLRQDGYTVSEALAAEEELYPGKYCRPDEGSWCHFNWWNPLLGQVHGEAQDYYCPWYSEEFCETCCPDETSDCEVGHQFDDDWGVCNT
jgi:hypothetical protein